MPTRSNRTLSVLLLGHHVMMYSIYTEAMKSIAALKYIAPSAKLNVAELTRRALGEHTCDIRFARETADAFG